MEDSHDMEHDTTARDEQSSLTRARHQVRGLWGDVKGVYWSNTPAWRVIKSGALVFLGFFLWVGSSVLMEYVDLTVLQYTRAYGFVVLVWGPWTHLVVVPAAIKLRRTAGTPLRRWLARHGSPLNLSVFLVLVLLLGTWPVGPMTLDFQGALADDGPGDVDPEVDCSLEDDLVTCHVEHVEGMDSVVVTSGERELDRDDDPPYELQFRADETEEVVGQRQFRIEVRGEDGERLRLFVRRLSQLRT